jgi:hypothetical protein
MYGIIMTFIIPFNIVTIIYSTLICRARRIRDNDLIVSTVLLTVNIHIPNIRREMKLTRNMSVLLCGGIPYLIFIENKTRVDFY